MRKFFIALMLSFLSAHAPAQNVPLSGGTISIGDSLEKLLKVGGKPDRVRPFSEKLSDYIVYEYSFKDRQVNVTVKDGKVTGIADNNIVSK